MKLKNTCFLFFAVIIYSGIYSPDLSAEDKKRADIVSLVRILGYGGAIHNFKNYIIRGKQKYHNKAQQLFSESKSTLALLRVHDLNNNELIALKNIDEMADNYLAALQVAQQAYAEKKTVAAVSFETDSKVNIDDRLAIEGIDILRQSYQWNNLEQLEFLLGYGKAIHNFKNYLLRGQEKYRESSIRFFEEVALKTTQLESFDIEHIENASQDILTTIQKYRKSIARIDKTALFINKTKNSRIIGSMISSSDKMIRVDDRLAVAGLDLLRKNYFGD